MKHIIMIVAVISSIGTSINAQGLWEGAYVGITGSINDGTQEYCFCDGDPEYDLEGTTYGLFAGYNFSRQNYVLGGEVVYSLGSIYETDGPNVYENYDFESIIDVKARVGYDMGSYLPYAALGFTSLDWSESGDHSTANGYLLGAGIDYAFNDQFFVGLEFVWRDVTNSDLDFEANVSSISLRAAYRY